MYYKLFEVVSGFSDIFSHRLAILNIGKFLQKLEYTYVCVGNYGFETLVKSKLEKTEAVVRRSSVKKMFLKISQNSQENTCARASFLTKLQSILVQCHFSILHENVRMDGWMLHKI